MFMHPGIDPTPVTIPTGWDEDGLVTTFDPRAHYNVTAGFIAANPALEPYRVAPNPLARVFAGDDPVDPAWTVALRFADDAQALASLGAWWVDPAG